MISWRKERRCQPPAKSIHARKFLVSIRRNRRTSSYTEGLILLTSNFLYCYLASLFTKGSAPPGHQITSQENPALSERNQTAQTQLQLRGTADNLIGMPNGGGVTEGWPISLPQPRGMGESSSVWWWLWRSRGRGLLSPSPAGDDTSTTLAVC